MKQLIGIVLLISLAGCLDPADGIQYVSSDPDLVVEGRINTSEPPYKVQVTLTVDVDASVNYLPVNSAIVYLSDGLGNSEKLSHTNDGVYVSSALQGNIGQTYTLEIAYNNQVYTAIDSIKAAPRIDSANVIYENSLIRKKGYYLVLYTQSEITAKHFYKVELTVNGELLSGYYNLLVMENVQGSEDQEYILSETFQQGDTIVVDVHSITETLYEYFRGLNKQVDNLYSTVQAPSLNPPSNFSDALGYFMASSVWSDTVIVQ